MGHRPLVHNFLRFLLGGRALIEDAGVVMTEGDLFTDPELTQLRAHGVVLFAGRVIYDAQPPMSEGDLSGIQRQCAGPLPAELRGLWGQTAGGRLDYDLPISMAGHLQSLSWSELFYLGSDGYHDLQGWIDHELELIAETGGEPPWWRRLLRPPGRASREVKLTQLPFGGFEYGERMYIGVERGPEYGHVIAWSQAIPWRFRLQEDALAEVAPSLLGAFAALCLEEDPLSPSGLYFAGESLFAYLDERQELGLEPALRNKLVGYYRRAVLDWATPLASGTLASEPLLAAVALRHAVATDDAGLIEQLVATGVSVDRPLQGSAVAIEVAVGKHAYAAAAALVRAGAAVPPDVLCHVGGAIPPELTAALLTAGAEPLAEAMVDCVAAGGDSSARLIAEAGGVNITATYGPARDTKLAELEDQLRKVLDPSGHYGHYLGADGLTEHIHRLRTFSL